MTADEAIVEKLATLPEQYRPLRPVLEELMRRAHHLEDQVKWQRDMLHKVVGLLEGQQMVLQQVIGVLDRVAGTGPGRTYHEVHADV